MEHAVLGNKNDCAFEWKKRVAGANQGLQSSWHAMVRERSQRRVGDGDVGVGGVVLAQPLQSRRNRSSSDKERSLRSTELIVVAGELDSDVVGDSFGAVRELSKDRSRILWKSNGATNKPSLSCPRIAGHAQLSEA